MSVDDTHPAVRAAQIERLRRMTETERFALVEDLTSVVVAAPRAAVRETMPGAPESAVMLRWIEPVYGPELARGVAPFADRLGGRTSQRRMSPAPNEDWRS